MHDAKPWWASKTIWTNLIGGVAMLLSIGGVDVIAAPDVQAQIVGAVMVFANLLLRVITTKPLTKSGADKAGALLIAAVLASGCTLGDGKIGPVPVADMQKFTVDDIDAAQKMAEAAGDQKAMACYPMLKRFVAERFVPMTAEVKGAVSAYQRARIARLRVQEGAPEYLEIACASLLNDSKGFVARLLARFVGL